MAASQSINPPAPQATASADLFCPECGYNLRGIESVRCPECGTGFDRATLSVTRIPWSHRRTIGWFKAYWRTVFCVVFRTGRFAREASRPVSYRDARLFRWITLVHLYVPAIILLGFLWSIDFGKPPAPPAPGIPLPIDLSAFRNLMDHRQEQKVIGSLYELAAPPTLWLAVGLFLLTATGVGSYFFHPQYLPVAQQDRAVAISQYACAALAFMPLGAVSLGISAWWDWRAPGGMRYGQITPLEMLLFTCNGLFLYGPLILWWLDSLLLLRRTTLCGAGRVLAMGVALPVFWTALGVVTLLGIPLATAFLVLLVLSLLA